MTVGVELEGFRDAFVEEAQELLANANARALELEVALREHTSQSRAVRELFRAVHTIKGLASMVNVEPIVALAHGMEEMLRDADRNGTRLALGATATIVSALDAIAHRVQSVAHAQGVAEPPSDVLNALAQGNAAEPPGPAPRSLAETVFLLDEEIASRLVAHDRLQLVQGVSEGKRALRLDFSPAPALAEQGHTITSVRERLATIADIVKVVPMADPQAPSGLSFVLLLLTAANDQRLRETVVTPIGDPKEVIALRESEAVETEPVSSGDAVRVDVARLDVSLECLGALVVTRFRLGHVVARMRAQGVDVRELTEVINDNARQLRNLRAALLRVRMVSLDELLVRMRLVVRGLTRTTAKRIRLEIDARGIEIDKGVADHLFPALLHLARNAVDHGVEPSAQRERQGKNGEALMNITCVQTSSTQIDICISDDGRGIDAAAVCAKAGVATTTTAAALLDVLCTPGFSSREEADTSSGRGMGMDIVKRAVVEKLGGSITLDTTLGHGTRFTLNVPLTIAIVDAFVFRCAEHRFVAPNTSIEEAIDVAHVTYPRGGRSGLIVHRGTALPFVELSDLLQLPRSERSFKAFIVRRHGELIALGVDKILTQQEVVVRPLEDPLVKVAGINGATDLGDGQPTLVLDLTRIAIQKAAA